MSSIRRSTLLFLYLFLIVLSSWVLEWLLIWETGYASYQIVEPLQNLSVAQLQLVLEKRGISYDTLVEKHEMINSIKKSGPVQYMELLAAAASSGSNGPIDIGGREEYFEEASEESESVWLIEVIPETSHYSGQCVLAKSTWDFLQEQLTSIGISSGRIYCNNDLWLCEQQGWTHPQLALVIPKTHIGSNVKASLHCPPNQQLSSKRVLTWLHSELNLLTKRIDNIEELEAVYLNTTVSKKREISQMVYITELLQPPLLLVTLGLKFSSRLRFAMFSVGKTEKKQVTTLLQKYKLNGPPNIIFTSPKSVSSYGHQKGEVFSVRALDAHIKLLQPRMNDIFVVSLFLANLLALLELLDVRTKLWKHILRTLCSLPVYNVAIFILWLSLTALFRITWLSPLFELSFNLVDTVCAVCNGGILVYYFVMVDHFLGLALLSFCIFGFVTYHWGKYREPYDDYLEENDSWYTVFPMDSYLVNVLFRPMASLSRPRPSHDVGLEEGMELLIERLATPDLWLHPVVPTDYIKNLPVWRYDGWGNEEDLKSESETDFDSYSDTDNEAVMSNHSCCQDSLCKMCDLWTTVKETYVCHRCALLKRKLEKQFFRYREIGDKMHQNVTYERLLKVCDNCVRTRRRYNAHHLKPSLAPAHSAEIWDLKWSAPHYAIESRLCAICLDKYRWSAVLCGLPCGHTYHYACIIEWLTKDNHHCPSCRWPSYKCKVSLNSDYFE